MEKGKSNSLAFFDKNTWLLQTQNIYGTILLRDNREMIMKKLFLTIFIVLLSVLCIVGCESYLRGDE